MHYFDIEHNPKTGRIAIDLNHNTTAVLFESGDRVQLIQADHTARSTVMIDKKVLLDLADYIRSLDGKTKL
jgi:hypothetical protein